MAYLEGANNLVYAMKNILVTALNKISTFRNSCMNAQVMLPTGVLVSNPFTSGNFAGMYRILEMRYNKPHLVSFMHCWLDAFGSRSAGQAKSIDAVLAVVSKFSATMDDRNMWDLVTKDTLSIIIVILGLDPQSNIRTKVIEKAIELMDDYYGDKNGGNMKDGGHGHRFSIHAEQSTPIFQKLESYMRDILQRTNELKLPRDDPKGGDQRGSGGKTSANRQDINGAFAANAEESAHAVTAQLGKTKLTDAHDPATPKFDTVISATAGHKVFDARKGIAYTYVAVPALKDICGECYDGQGNKKADAPTTHKNHFRTQCNRCKYYGHNAGQCLQKKGVDGSTLPPKTSSA